jgi:hypothetical protein
MRQTSEGKGTPIRAALPVRATVMRFKPTMPVVRKNCFECLCSAKTLRPVKQFGPGGCTHGEVRSRRGAPPRGGPVEAMPMVLHTHEGIWRWIGKAWPQAGVWPAAVVMG